MWYLHGPDRSVPYEVTLKAVNDLYKEGYFKRFGISNYMASVPLLYFGCNRVNLELSWEVAEMVSICKRFGYIQPTAYQGIYNAIHRGVEPELFPCLRKFGISFYEFNPRTTHLVFFFHIISHSLQWRADFSLAGTIPRTTNLRVVRGSTPQPFREGYALRRLVFASRSECMYRTIETGPHSPSVRPYSERNPQILEGAVFQSPGIHPPCRRAAQSNNGRSCVALDLPPQPYEPRARRRGPHRRLQLEPH
jgi:hypothetical protein